MDVLHLFLAEVASLEVERARFFRARAELELSESRPDEPEPDKIGYRACFELCLIKAL